MKLSIYSLSIKDKSPGEIISLAQDFSCEGVEWWCREGGHVDTAALKESAGRIKSLMQNSNLETAGIAPYFTCNESESEISRICEAAEIIRAGNLRCQGYKYPQKESVQVLADRQRKWLEEVVIPVLEKFKKRIVLEQHHSTILPTPDACWRLVDKLPPERVGIIYDPGNSLFDGYTRPEYALSVFGEYLSHVHVKSAKNVKEGGTMPAGRRYPMLWGPLSDGDIDWEQIVMLLSNRGYKGFLSLEALDDRNSMRKLQEDIPLLRSYLDKYCRG